MTSRGWGGQPVKAWLMLPRERSGPLPAVVQYIGYNGGRGIPCSWLTWSALGHAHPVMDNRGQGGGGKNTADTVDLGPDGNGSSSPGFPTRGIEDPCRHYYRRLITDAGPYAEIARWLSGHRFRVDEAMETLSYFDGVEFAARASVPAWFSVGLLDRICPSSTVFAAYHRYTGPARIEVFTYNGHEGGAEYDLPRKIGALRGVFGQ